MSADGGLADKAAAAAGRRLSPAMRRRIAGLCAITPDRDDDALPRDAAAAVDGGAAVLQYRRGAAPSARRAAQLAEICRRRGALFIVNNDARLAAEVGADGVHLGRRDMPVGAARKIVGGGAIIGVTCHDSIATALEAQAAGADYVAFGALFPSLTKPEARLCRLRVVAAARRRLAAPIVVIGGVAAANVAVAAATGADAVAVCAGLFSAPDIAAAARRLSAAWHVAPAPR